MVCGYIASLFVFCIGVSVPCFAKEIVLLHFGIGVQGIGVCFLWKTVG
jgi:hypothetical protein